MYIHLTIRASEYAFVCLFSIRFLLLFFSVHFCITYTHFIVCVCVCVCVQCAQYAYMYTRGLL